MSRRAYVHRDSIYFTEDNPGKEFVEMIVVADIPKPQSLLNHIYKKVSEVERATKSVCVLQFAVHPEGMAMILRCYQASIDKEHSFTDVITASEVVDGGVETEIKRIDVLFDTIHKALNSVQTIKAGTKFH